MWVSVVALGSGRQCSWVRVTTGQSNGSQVRQAISTGKGFQSGVVALRLDWLFPWGMASHTSEETLYLGLREGERQFLQSQTQKCIHVCTATMPSCSVGNIPNSLPQIADWIKWQSPRNINQLGGQNVYYFSQTCLEVTLMNELTYLNWKIFLHESLAVHKCYVEQIY